MHSAQIRANFAQNQPSKRLLRKKTEKKSSDDFEESPLSRALRRASSLWEGAFGMAAKFPA